MRKWSLHIDHPLAACVRKDGAPLRVYIRTPNWFWIIALWPGHQSQVYDRKTKTWTNRFAWVTRHPSR